MTAKYRPYKRFEMGDPVTFSEEFIRVFDHSSNRWSWSPKKLPEPMDGVYIGYRYKRVGTVCYYPEEGTEFRPESSVLCAAIVVNERTAPVAVPFDSLKKREWPWHRRL